MDKQDMLDTIDSLIVSVVSAMDEEVEELVGWELSTMDYTSLQEFFVNNMTDYYRDNPKALNDMLDYKKGIEDTEVVLYWDTDKKDVQPITTRKPSWVENKDEKVDPNA